MKFTPRLLGILALLCVSQLVHGQRIFWNEPNNNRIRFGGLTYTTLAAGTNLLSGPTLISNISLDPGYNLIFFTEGSGSTLYQANYNGSGAFERYIFGAMSEGTDIAYSQNAGGVYATIYFEAGGISFIPETTGASQSLNLGTKGNHVFTCITVDDGSERIFFYDLDDDAIGYSSFADDGVVDILSGYGEIVAMDYDDASNRLAFVNTSGQIYLCDGDGSNVDAVTDAANDVSSLVYYSGYNKIYFVSNERIWSVNPDGTGLTSMLTLTGTGVTDLGVEPDETLPTVTSRYPANGQTGITLGETFTLDFTEQIRKSADAAMGSQRWVRIIRTSDSEPMDTIDRDDPRLSFTGGTLTIAGAEYSGSNTDFHILIGNRVVEDMAGNNFVGFTLATQWAFTTGTIVDESKYYSRQSGDWDDLNTWSHVGHGAGDPPVTSLPGTGSDVEIGAGHTVTMTQNETVVGNSEGVVVQAGGTLDMQHFELHVWGDFRIEGTMINGGILSGIWTLSSATLPVFDGLSVGVGGFPDQIASLNCNVVSIAPVVFVDGGTLTTNGFEVCTAPSIPVTPVYSNIKSTSITLSWTSGGGDAFVVMRPAGTPAAQPAYESLYTASAAFGSGGTVGTGNYVVYIGTGNTVNLTGLSATTTYELDMYGFNTTIGGCYSLTNYQTGSFTTCSNIAAPTNPQNGQYCSGDTKQAVIVDDPGSGMTINWYDAATGGNLVPGNGTGGSGRGEVFIPTAASGTFYAETYDGTLGCSSATRTAVTLTMNPALVPGTATGTQSVCAGGDPTAITGGTATGGNGAYTYEWGETTTSGGPYMIVPGVTSANYDPPSGLTQTTYYIRLTRSGSCADKWGNEVTVTVTNPAAIVSPPPNRTVCGSIATGFGVTATGTALTYQWQVDNGSGFTNVNNGGVYSGALTANLAISNTAGLNGFKYQCIVYSSGACPVTTAFGTLTVNPLPAALDQTIQECETIAGSGTANLNLMDYDNLITGGVANSVVWYDDPSYTSAVSTPNNVSATDGRIYYPRVFGPNTCTDDATLTVDIITAPEVTPAPADKPICSGAATALTFTSVPAGATYAWTVTPNASITGASNGSGTNINQVLNNISATRQQMTYTIIPSLGGCDGPAFQQKVFVDPVPTIFNVTGGGIVCEGGAGVAIGLSGSQNGFTYTLLRDGSATGQTAAGTGAALSFPNNLLGGSYTITGTTAANCSAPMNGSATVTLSNGPVGTGTIGGPSQLCLGQEQTFTVTGVTGALTYQWQLPPGVEAVAPSTSASITVVITTEITGATIFATPSNDCGAGTPVQKAIASLPVPGATITGPTESILVNEPAQFGFFSNANISTVRWSFGDGQTSQDHEPTVTYVNAGDYNVDLEVTDVNGCTNTIRHPVTVLPEAALADFVIKNVVTANGDGMNDQLIIENIEQFPDNEVILIDRWGAEVFRTKNYDNSWEFKRGENYLPAGNYVCVLKSGGKTYSRTITVLKQN